MAKRLVPSVVLAIVAAVSMLVLACADSGHVVAFENKTDEAVTVFTDGRFDLQLGPHEIKKVSVLTLRNPTTYEARAAQGEVIDSITITWEQLREQGWRITFARR